VAALQSRRAGTAQCTPVVEGRPAGVVILVANVRTKPTPPPPSPKRRTVVVVLPAGDGRRHRGLVYAVTPPLPQTAQPATYRPTGQAARADGNLVSPSAAGEKKTPRRSLWLPLTS
jgi:hypothetical protein